jgi:hypothetical protein
LFPFVEVAEVRCEATDDEETMLARKVAVDGLPGGQFAQLSVV